MPKSVPTWRRLGCMVLLTFGAFGVSGLQGEIVRASGSHTLDKAKPALGRIVGKFPPLCTTNSIPYLPSFGWPVQPFNKQHPIRGNLNDPRFLEDTSDGSKLLHNGIDIVAPDGTPIYAVEPGKVVSISPPPEGIEAVGVVSAGGREFKYAHIVPDSEISVGKLVALHQEIGRIAFGHGHLHFVEIVNGQRVNPLRPGALEPYSDNVSPVEDNLLAFNKAGSQVSSQVIKGQVSLAVDAYDPPPIAPAVPWENIRVAPALISWQVKSSAGQEILNETTAVDFSQAFCTGLRPSEIYAPGTYRNSFRPDDNPKRPGHYNFWLIRDWNTNRMSNGEYIITVNAQDNRDNTTKKSFVVTIKN